MFQKRKIAPLLAALTLAALACSFPLFGPSDEDGPSSPTGEAPPAPTTDAGNAPPAGPPDQTAPTDGAQLQAGEPLDLDNPSLYSLPDFVSTYRTSLDYIFTAEGPVTGTLTFDQATQVDPYATTMTLDGSGTSTFAEAADLAYTEIDGTEYIQLAGFGCHSGIPGESDEAFDIILDGTGMLTGMAEFSGEETVNGVETYRYTLTLDNLDPLDESGMDFRAVNNGALYVARDGGYAVRVLIEGRAVNGLISDDPNLEGDVYYELNFYDFNAPLAIEIPEGCTQSTQGGSPLPMLADATNVVGFDTLTSYNTGESVGDVIEFYEEAMPAFSCSAPEVFGGDDTGSASMTFTGCEMGTVSIVAVAESSDVTVVTIFIEP